MIFQAGASKAGRAFAAKHAECIYLGGVLPSNAAESVKQIRALASSQGRDPKSIKFFSGISPIIGRTIEEAQEKYNRAKSHADIIAGLAQFSWYTGIDLSIYPLDEPFTLSSEPNEHAIHGAIESFIAASQGQSQSTTNTTSSSPSNLQTNKEEQKQQKQENQENQEKIAWTPRLLGQKMALGGFHLSPVGTPEMIADVMEEWIRVADVDGFNISYTTAPESFEDVVYLLRPVLVERGLMDQEYEVVGGTLRENVYGVGQRGLRGDHYGAGFKWRKEEEEEEVGKGRDVGEVLVQGVGGKVEELKV